MRLNVNRMGKFLEARERFTSVKIEDGILYAVDDLGVVWIVPASGIVETTCKKSVPVLWMQGSYEIICKAMQAAEVY